MAENKGYMTLSDEKGSIHISEEVIAAIAVGAVREVEGVSGTMGTLGSSVADLVTNKKGAQKNAKGVKIEMTETALWTPAEKGREAACRRSPGLAQLRPLCWAAEPESPEWLRRPER